MSGMVQVPYGNTVVNRIAPLMPAASYKTYAMERPLQTHWVAATCEEVECAAFLNGWVTHLDVSTELGQQQYHYCSHDNSRSYTEARDGSVVSLTYPSGTRCFRSGEHKRLLERPALFVVRDGDWRGNPRGTRAYVHSTPESWVDDFATHQDRLATEIEKG